MVDEELIHKWMSGKLTEAERTALASQPDFVDLSKLISYLDNWEGPSLDKQNMLAEILAQPKPALNPQTKQSPAKVRALWSNWVTYAVATAVVCLVAIWLWPNPNPTPTPTPTILMAQAGERLEETLPDGSRVSLNAGTEVRYLDSEWIHDRRLELQGEAYFEVKKGSNFEVVTALGSVTVLGTRFNVRARDGGLKVTCYEGKVRIEEEGNKVEIEAGERYHQAKRQLLDQVEKPSWTQAIIVLDEVRLDEVIAEMERQFDVTIQTSAIDLDVEGTYSF